MTKKELRTGMVLTCKNGNHYLYIKDYDDFEDGVAINLDPTGGILDMRFHNDDLTRNVFHFSSPFDVIKIEDRDTPVDIRRCFTDEYREHNVIWTREPKTFKVVCVECLKSEKYFTPGKIYTWKDNTLKNDKGFTYTSIMVDGTDPDKWDLSRYYKFIKVVE